MKSPNYAGKDFSCKNEKIRIGIIDIVEDIYTAEVKVKATIVTTMKIYGRQGVSAISCTVRKTTYRYNDITL